MIRSHQLNACVTQDLQATTRCLKVKPMLSIEAPTFPAMKNVKARFGGQKMGGEMP